MAVLAGSFCSNAQAKDPEAPDLYVKGETWGETMLASRAKHTAWAQGDRARLPLELGSWYATEALSAKNFEDVYFTPGQVTLKEKDKKDKKLWRKQSKWTDGKAISLKGKNNASTYLYRTITALAPTQVTAAMGSDDGIEVWLNGKKVHSVDAPRGVSQGGDKVNLDLKKGENTLLVKIYNRTGNHGFYFLVSKDPLEILWERIKRDFPREAQWMEGDTGGDSHLGWFREAGNANLERKMVERVLKDLGAAKTAYQEKLDGLRLAKASPQDPEWLGLYARAADVRERLATAKAQIKQVNMRALRMAIEDLARSYPDKYAKSAEYLKRLVSFEKQLGKIEEAVAKGDDVSLDMAEELLAFQREALLSNPLLDFDKMLVVKRKAQGKLGLPQNWQGNCALPRSGFDDEIAVLTDYKSDAKLQTLYKPEAPVFVGDVDLHYDGQKMLFSMPGPKTRWQIWEVGVDGKGLRQVTPGKYDDVDNYDACYLPDERIIFASTRCYVGVPCVGGKSIVANLCIMDPDGGAVRQLCFDQDTNWCPTVMNNGRVLYTRWEYSDTSHYFSRILFNMNPDGTNQGEYYGSNSYWPNSMFYTRPIPNHPTKIVTIISGHHGAARMGEMIIMDPSKGRFEADGVVQRVPGYGQKVEPVIADQLVKNSWPKFLHPFPLSENYFLVAAKPDEKANWGIYLVDVFDNMTLLKETPGYVLFEPLPLRKTQRQPILPDRVDLARTDATVYLSDIYSGPGLAGVPRGKVKKLRLYEFHFAYPNMGGHKAIGVEGTWDVHRIMGTVPVYEDGSAMFRIPANTSIAVQPLDSEGRALQIMRSWFTAMPGETLSCVGCHDRQNQTPGMAPTIAATQTPSEITPWYGPTRGFSFTREVQPVLDKYCAGCHNGKPHHGKQIPNLARSEEKGWNNFTPSYLALHPFVRRPGPESNYHLEVPMEWYANTSELVQMLHKGHHGVQIDAEGWERLYAWIDLNVPDHGSWGEYKTIPNDGHQRRMNLRAQYANVTEDPELMPELKTELVKFVKPKHAPRLAALNVTISNWPFNAEEAKRLQNAAGAQTRQTLDLGEGARMEMVLVPAGEYIMGNNKGYRDEGPAHRVKIDKPFWMSVREVSAGQFRRFNPNHDNGYIDQNHKDHTTPGYPVNAPDLPAMRISWKEAMAFGQWLSDRTGRACSIPTEAQWEWACRAGSDQPFHFGDLDTDFSPYANLADVSIRLLAVSGVNPKPIKNPSPYEDWMPKDARFDDSEKLMSAVGKYQPNAWGLKDMHGNVAEWTRTTSKPYPYNALDGRDDPASRGLKIVRGGSWFDRPKRATSSFRLEYEPYQKVFNVGFRVVMEADARIMVTLEGE